MILRNTSRNGRGTLRILLVLAIGAAPRKALVPEAGIEPARLAAGDFESADVSRFHAGFRPVCSAFVADIGRAKPRKRGTLFRLPA